VLTNSLLFLEVFQFIYVLSAFFSAGNAPSSTMTTTSANFGPLTTTFTPPSDCFTEQWIQHNTNSTILAWGPTCDAAKVGYASSCYPTGWSGSKSDNSNLNYKAFSPGLICPSGFTATFSASHIQATKSFLLSEYVTSLGKNDVATVCCPS
jgi:hypothetical protein